MSQIGLIQVTLKLSEIAGFLYEEVPSYSTGHLVSDIGGALGLVLGLSILDCLVFSGIVLRKALRAISMFSRVLQKTYNVTYVNTFLVSKSEEEPNQV